MFQLVEVVIGFESGTRRLTKREGVLLIFVVCGFDILTDSFGQEVVDCEHDQIESEEICIKIGADIFGGGEVASEY